VRPLSPSNLYPVRRLAFTVPGLGIGAPAKLRCASELPFSPQGRLHSHSCQTILLAQQISRGTFAPGHGSGLLPLKSSLFCLCGGACPVPRREAEYMASLRAIAENGLYYALDLFRSSMTPWGATEVSCRARPALFSFGIFFPWLQCALFKRQAPTGSGFPLAPAPGVSGDHPGDGPVMRALLAADGDGSAPVVHPQERPLLGRAGSR
jgi:hypothetical protein